MATFVGQIDASLSTGNVSYTSPGFTPSAVIMWGTQATADGDTDSTSANFSFGFTDGSNAQVVSASAQHGGAQLRSWARGASVYRLQDHLGVVLAEAEIVSFNNDGFTLNWTTAAGAGYDINILVIGGVSVTGVKVGEFTISATGNTAETGVGFQPDAVIMLHSTATTIPSNGTDNMKWGLGLDDAVTAAGMSWQFGTGASTIGATSSVLSLVAEDSGGAAQFEAKVGSLDADGFTVDTTTLSGSRSVAYIALQMADVAVGVVETGTSTGDLANTDPGFTPEFLFTFAKMSAWSPPATTQIHEVEFSLSISAADGTSHGLSYIGKDPALVGFAQNSSAIVQLPVDENVPSVDQVLGTLSSFDASGFTLNFTTAGNNQPLFYLAGIGGGVVGTFDNKLIYADGISTV